jgi:hypothetical protein
MGGVASAPERVVGLRGWHANLRGFAHPPFASGAKLRIFDNEFRDRTIVFCNTLLNISGSNVQPWLGSHHWHQM